MRSVSIPNQESSTEKSNFVSLNLFSSHSPVLNSNEIDIIFKEVKEIRAINKENPSLDDMVICGFTTSLFMNIIYGEDFKSKYVKKLGESCIDSSLQRMFIISALTDQIKIGNCCAQASLGICKILIAGLQLKLSLLQMKGKGHLALENSQYLPSSPRDHVFALINSNINNAGGLVFDTWGFDKIFSNPGMTTIAKTIGFTDTVHISNIYQVEELGFSHQLWKSISDFFDFVGEYLTNDKIIGLSSRSKMIALQELEIFYGPHKSNELQSRIDPFMQEENLKSLNVLIHNSLGKWGKICLDKSVNIESSLKSSLHK